MICRGYQARLVRSGVAAIAACVVLSAAARGQVLVGNSIRLELRIQPQVGLPADPGGVVDVPGTAHLPITAAGQVRRFEVQYRLLDLDPANAVEPWAVLSFQFTLSFTGGGNGMLERAVLSRAERTPNPPPAMSPDLSGPPTSSPDPSRWSRGLHAPFLRNSDNPAEYPFNDVYENGRFAPGPGGPAQVIREISPLRISPTPTSEVGTWYGLYSFNFISGTMIGGDVVLAATLLGYGGDAPDFGFWTEDPSRPYVSYNMSMEAATIPVPAPGAAGLGVVVLAAAGVNRWRGSGRGRSQ